MPYLIALIGSATATAAQVPGIISYHLDPAHAGVWTDVPRTRITGGLRVVAKIAGAKVIALTGTIRSKDAVFDPIEVDGRTLRWRYNVDWDRRPDRWIDAHDLGAPFDRPLRSMCFGKRWNDFVRAYRALHGQDPPRQTDSDHWAMRSYRERR